MTGKHTSFHLNTRHLVPATNRQIRDYVGGNTCHGLKTLHSALSFKPLTSSRHTNLLDDLLGT
jgi:hypothetical protein